MRTVILAMLLAAGCAESVAVCERTGEPGACAPILIVGNVAVDASSVAAECEAIGAEPADVPVLAADVDAAYLACASEVESCGSFCGCWVGTDGQAISIGKTSAAEYGVVNGPAIDMLPVCMIR